MLVCLIASLANFQSITFQLTTLFIINLFASIQDVIVDAEVVSMLNHNTMAIAGITQVVAYKLGAVFLGGIGSVFVDFVGWSGFLFIMSFFFFGATLLSLNSEELIFHEENEIAVHVSQVLNSDSQLQESISTFFKSVIQSLNDSKLLFTIMLLIIYKLGEQGTLRITPLYLLTMGIPKAHVTAWLNLAGGILSIMGSVIGGFFVGWKGFTSKQSLWFIFNLRLIPSSLIMLIAIANRNTEPNNYSAFFEVSMLFNDMWLSLMGGMITTIMCTLMLQLAKLQPRHLQATHMSLFTTIEVLGKLTFLSVAGYFTQLFGFSGVFLIFNLIDIFSIPIVQKI